MTVRTIAGTLKPGPTQEPALSYRVSFESLCVPFHSIKNTGHLLLYSLFSFPHPLPFPSKVLYDWKTKKTPFSNTASLVCHF